MYEITEDSVLVIRKDKKVVGFVHLDVHGDALRRVPIFYTGTEMGFENIKELFSSNEIIK